VFNDLFLGLDHIPLGYILAKIHGLLIDNRLLIPRNYITLELIIVTSCTELLNHYIQ